MININKNNKIDYIEKKNELFKMQKVKLFRIAIKIKKWCVTEGILKWWRLEV